MMHSVSGQLILYTFINLMHVQSHAAEYYLNDNGDDDNNIKVALKMSVSASKTNSLTFHGAKCNEFEMKYLYIFLQRYFVRTFHHYHMVM